MSSQGNGQPPIYDVRMPGQVQTRLQQLHLQTRAAGRSKAFLAALRQIIERLRTDPLTFGEPLYRLPALRLRVRQAVIDFVVVDYAVHEERPLVFIRSFKLLG